MAINRRDFLKFSAGTGLVLAAEPEIAQAGTAAKKELPPEAVGILYDATLCIGCKACMVSCKQANSEPGGALYDPKTDGYIPYEYDQDKLYDAPTTLSDKTLCLIKAYSGKDEEGNEEFSFMKEHCLHCVDPACASVCPVAALKKDPITGIVTYTKSRCIGCRYCQIGCPFGIPAYEFGKSSPGVIKCQLCNHRYEQGGYSACCEACPTGASLFGKVSDLQEEAKRRLALKPGESYAYPVNRIDSGNTTEQKVKEYVQHCYGLNEAGGTQYLFLAGVEFDKLGFNPRVTDQSYPPFTWSYISHVPHLIGALLVAGTTLRLVTQRLDNDKAKDSSENKDNE